MTAMHRRTISCGHCTASTTASARADVPLDDPEEVAGEVYESWVLHVPLADGDQAEAERLFWEGWNTGTIPPVTKGPIEVYES